MKKLLLVLLVMMAIVTSSFANDARMSVESGFEKGDATIVSEAMADRLFMVSYPLRRSLQKNEAVQELSKFFKTNPPKSFTVLHDNSQGGVIYMICKYETVKQSFRIHVLIDADGENEKISQIRIEEL